MKRSFLYDFKYSISAMELNNENLSQTLHSSFSSMDKRRRCRHGQGEKEKKTMIEPSSPLSPPFAT